MAVIKSAQSSNFARQAMVLDMSDLGRQAQRMLDEARKQAEQVIAEAMRTAQTLIDGADERGYEQGMDRGMNEGREIGRREAYEQALNDWNHRFEQLHVSFSAALQEWEARRQEVVHQATEDVIAFAMEVARRVTHRVAQLDQTLVRDQVAAALKLVSKPTAIEIVIHPRQRELIEQNLPQLLAAVGSCRHASIREDDSLMAGGCVITTPGGRIDASIETQLQRIAESFALSDPAAEFAAMTEPPSRATMINAEQHGASDPEHRSSGGNSEAPSANDLSP